MLGKLIILGAILIGVILFLDWFRRTPPEKVARMLKKSALYAAIAVVVLLAATGRLSWLFAALGAAIPLLIRGFNLLRALPVIRQLMAQLGLFGSARATPSPGAGQSSSIRTRFLAMVLDHATGAIDGTVLEGPYRGRQLAGLSMGELLDLFAICRGEDAESAAVLEAYLDRNHDDWRAQAAAGDAGADTGSSAMGTGEMTREEAWAVLGLQPGASGKEIRDAHRRLMQKLHPDRGGSNYLAAKINQAKDLLLEG